jgi:hypothetical protein
MDSLNDPWKALDGSGQEARKHANAAAGESGEHVGAAAVKTWKHLDGYGEEAGNQVGLAAESATKRSQAHSGETFGIVAGAVAAPMAIQPAITGLHAAGFASAGMAGGIGMSLEDQVRALDSGLQETRARNSALELRYNALMQQNFALAERNDFVEESNIELIHSKMNPDGAHLRPECLHRAPPKNQHAYVRAAEDGEDETGPVGY